MYIICKIHAFVGKNISAKNSHEDLGKKHFKIYRKIGIYTDEESVKKINPGRIIAIEPNSVVLSSEIQLPEGEYVIGLLQDSNGNGHMDYGLFGIPKEPYGWSNMKGKIPGNFNQLKVKINNQNNKIIIPLVVY
jgi:uncharacterized protein (DUF2141 family)